MLIGRYFREQVPSPSQKKLCMKVSNPLTNPTYVCEVSFPCDWLRDSEYFSSSTVNADFNVLSATQTSRVQDILVLSSILNWFQTLKVSHLKCVRWQKLMREQKCQRELDSYIPWYQIWQGRIEAGVEVEFPVEQFWGMGKQSIWQDYWGVERLRREKRIRMYVGIGFIENGEQVLMNYLFDFNVQY